MTTYSQYRFHGQPNGFDSLTLVKDLKTPALKKGEVLVKVNAVSLNYRDLVLAKGKYPCKEDVVPCSDGAGEVVEVGDGVSKWQKGDRVMGQFTLSLIAGPFDEDSHMPFTLGGGCDGMLSEYVVLPDSGLVRIPDHLSFEEGATLPCAALTAWNALLGAEGVNRLLPGETVVVQGTGGVSCFGAQLAILSGANVVATSSSDDKLNILRDSLKALAPDLNDTRLKTVNYKTNPDWDKAVKEFAPEGAEHVIEVGGAGTVEKTFNCLRRGGSISSIGFVGTRPDAPLPNIAMLALRKGATFRGMLVGSRKQFEQMNAAISTFKLKPIIGKVFEYEDAKAAYEYQWSQGMVGKVVIKVGAKQA